MLQALINDKLFDEEHYSNSRTSSIGSNDPVIILNPTQYTCQEELDDEIENDHTYNQLKTTTGNPLLNT